MAFLVHVDPVLHMNRWYSVTVQATLLEPVAVICAWGSRETPFMQAVALPMPTREEAEELAAEIVARKIKRGYCEAEIT